MKALSRRGFLDVTLLLVIVVIALGVFFTSGFKSKSQRGTENYTPETLPAGEEKKSLQLNTLKFVKLPTPPPSCSTTTSDTILIIDNSGSMKGEKLAKAKIAAGNFIDIVSSNNSSRVGLVLFSRLAQLLSSLTTDYTFLKQKISQIPESGNTCIQCGVKTANQEMQANARPNVKKAAILLSDGRANHVDGKSVGKDEAVNAAMNEVLTGNAATSTVFYPIGFGNNVNTSFLQDVALRTGGEYFFSPTENELLEAFARIAQRICQ